MPQTYTILAYELRQFGCPHCGYRSGFIPIQWGNMAFWRCAECDKVTCVIEDPSGNLPNIQPVPAPLTKHPRFGIPSHGRPDKRPKSGGDFFRSRGMSTDSSPGCFACEINEKHLYSNTVYVQCKVAGERIVSMFDKNGIRLDYRRYEPDYVQVKYVRQPKNLIFTIGYTESYETYFKEQKSPEKLGRTKIIKVNIIQEDVFGKHIEKLCKIALKDIQFTV